MFVWKNGKTNKRCVCGVTIKCGTEEIWCFSFNILIILRPWVCIVVTCGMLSCFCTVFFRRKKTFVGKYLQCRWGLIGCLVPGLRVECDFLGFWILHWNMVQWIIFRWLVLSLSFELCRIHTCLFNTVTPVCTFCTKQRWWKLDNVSAIGFKIYGFTTLRKIISVQGTVHKNLKILINLESVYLQNCPFLRHFLYSALCFAFGF